MGVAKLVRQLRKAEVPVEDGRAFLAAGTDERRRLLESYRVSLRARLVSAQTVLDELESSMTTNEDASTGKCRVSADALGQALGQVLFAAGTDAGRPELAGVLVEGKDGSLRLVASDSYRMAVRDIVPDALTQEATSAPSSGRRTSSRSKTGYPSARQCELSQGGSGGA